MDPSGHVVTLYPLSVEGAIVPPGYDAAQFVGNFEEQLVKQLRKKGLNVQPPTGPIAEGMQIRGRLVQIKAGSSAAWFMFGLIGALLSGGGSIFEVEGAIGDPQAAYGQFHETGRMSYGSFRGKNERGIKMAAVLAGSRTSKSILKILKGR